MSPLFHLYRVLPAVSSPPLPFLPVCSPKRAGQLNNWLLMSELSPVITAVPPYAIGLLFCHAIAVISTVFRLVYRHRRFQLYWDDLWAFIALICDIFLTVLLIIRMPTVLPHLSLMTQSFIRWSLFIFNPTEIWATRLSITMTVVRILPPGRSRLISKFGCGGFVLMWLIVIIQKIFICGIPVPAIPTCSPRATPILAITTNSIGTAWLVLWPAYILLRMRYKLLKLSQIKLPSTHHRVLIACFSTSVLLLIVNISHAVYFFSNDETALRITGHLEVSLSLFLCNILVIVTYIYRVFGDPENVSSFADSSWSHSGRISQVQSRPKKQSTHSRGGPDIVDLYDLKEFPPSSPADFKGQKLGRRSLDYDVESNDKLPDLISPR